MAFEYNCPHCSKELNGSFGDDVYCDDCDKSYETDWDYNDSGDPAAWLTGTEYAGDTTNSKKI